MEHAVIAVQPFQREDLKRIGYLQPQSWPDIIPEFAYYVKAPFCHPVKVQMDQYIIGLGASIVFRDTAWLAHIIVDSGHRKKGIGSRIVDHLLNQLDELSVSSCLLIATPDGASIYKKAGFKVVSEYTFLQRRGRWPEHPLSPQIQPYSPHYQSNLMSLDMQITGEDRFQLLNEFISNTWVYISDNGPEGYYLPSLGEGTIITANFQAGIELTKVRNTQSDKTVLPSDNEKGIDFLKENGFETLPTRGTRMVRGQPVHWKPENIFARMGGNFG